jgi:hypothetical protein
MLSPNLSFLRLLALFCVLTAPLLSFSQDEQLTLFFDALLKQTQKRNAIYTLQLSQIGGDIFGGTILSDKKDVKAVGQWKLEDKRYLEHGQFIFFYSTGQIESQGEYDRGVKVGNWQRYEENGTRKADRYYNPESAAAIRKTLGIK